MKLTESKLRTIIREILSENQMLKIIDDPYEPHLGEFANRVANYALTDDLGGALNDPELMGVGDDIDWYIDEMYGRVKRVGTAQGNPAPDGWDINKVHAFMKKLASAANKKMYDDYKAAQSADPDSAWLKWLSSRWAASIGVEDIGKVKWKQYRRYIRLAPPPGWNSLADDLHITDDDFGYSNTPGTQADFLDFLNSRAGEQLGRRKPTKTTTQSYYD